MKLAASSAHLVPVVLRRLAELPRPGFDFVLECAEVSVASEMRRLGAPHMLALDVWKKRDLDQAFRLGVDWTCAQKPRPVQWPFPSARLRSIIRNAPSQNVCAFNINDEKEMHSLPDMLAEVVSSRAARRRPSFSFA